MNDRIPAEAELAWERFHEVVNMTSEELRTWLMTQSSGEEAFGAEPDLGLPELGRGVVKLLGKRKVDLTGEDVEVMMEVADTVTDLEASRPSDGAADERWRRALMSVGHDPLRP